MVILSRKENIIIPFSYMVDFFPETLHLANMNNLERNNIVKDINSDDKHTIF